MQPHQFSAKLTPEGVLMFASRNENEIIKAHDSHIKALAVRFSRGAEDQKDIEQIGRIALLKASRRWDANHVSASKLWTYARPGVFGAMLVHATKSLAIAFEEVSITDDDNEVIEQGACEPNQESAIEVSDLLQGLDVEEKSVIRLSLTGLGLVEVGYCLEISKSEVWRIYQRAVSKMQRTISEGT